MEDLLTLPCPPYGALVVAGSLQDPDHLLVMAEHGANTVAASLRREQVVQLHEALSEWLVDTEPDPDVPGRPL